MAHHGHQAEWYLRPAEVVAIRFETCSALGTTRRTCRHQAILLPQRGVSRIAWISRTGIRLTSRGIAAGVSRREAKRHAVPPGHFPGIDSHLPDSSAARAHSHLTMALIGRTYKITCRRCTRGGVDAWVG